MTPDERQLLAGLFDRVRTAQSGPKDNEAEAFINDAMRSAPSAGYVLSQTVLVQQQALEAAAKRISELEAHVNSGAPQEQGSFLGNLGRSIFGGGGQPPQNQPRAYDARGYEGDQGPPPGYAPQQRPGYAPPPQAGGPWGGGAPQYAAPQGGGFLQGALRTATGVAGGVLIGDAIGNLIGGHGGGGLFGGGLGGGLGGGRPEETINETNNYYGTDPAGQHAEDVLQDQDQDQDYAQDAGFDNGGGGDDA